MPTGIPKNGKRKPRALAGPISSQTQALIEHMQEMEERLAVLRRKDKARAGLLAYARKFDLEASDLREAAKHLAARETGEAVISPNLGKAKRMALGRKIKEARLAKKLGASELAKLIGTKAASAVHGWEHGMIPGIPKYRAGLIKHLDLPKDFFADVPPRGKMNGAHP
jgi:DNA-binding transcriptional regulator YiaG